MLYPLFFRGHRSTNNLKRWFNSWLASGRGRTRTMGSLLIGHCSFLYLTALLMWYCDNSWRPPLLIIQSRSDWLLGNRTCWVWAFKDICSAIIMSPSIVSDTCFRKCAWVLIVGYYLFLGGLLKCTQLAMPDILKFQFLVKMLQFLWLYYVAALLSSPDVSGTIVRVEDMAINKIEKILSSS